MTTILITGATDGIGLESAKQISAQLGDQPDKQGRLLLVGRNPAKLDAAANAVRNAGSAEVTTLLCDFAELASVRKLADEVLATVDRLDVLVNNAGTVFDRRTLTVDGHESTFAVNHLAGFLLTERLKELLVASAPSRVVLTASVGHYQGTMDFDDLGFERGYSIMKAYYRSKLANVLYTRHLAAELAGSGVTVNCLHPGTVATHIWSQAPWFARPVLEVAKRVAMIKPEEGGRRLTQLAIGGDVAGTTGEYFDNYRPKQPSRLARDPELGARLRDVSAELVGLA